MVTVTRWPNKSFTQVIPQEIHVTHKEDIYSGQSVGYATRKAQITVTGMSTAHVGIETDRNKKEANFYIWYILSILYNTALYHALQLSDSLGSMMHYYRGTSDTVDLHAIVWGDVANAELRKELIEIAENTTLSKNGKRFPVSRLLIHNIL